MADIYIHRITADKYPNLIREFNKHTSRPVTYIYEVSYMSGRRYEPLGNYRTKGDAIKAGKKYATRRLNTKTINWKHMKNGKPTGMVSKIKRRI